MIEFGGSRWHQ